MMSYVGSIVRWKLVIFLFSFFIGNKALDVLFYFTGLLSATVKRLPVLRHSANICLFPLVSLNPF